MKSAFVEIEVIYQTIEIIPSIFISFRLRHITPAIGITGAYLIEAHGQVLDSAHCNRGNKLAIKLLCFEPKKAPLSCH